MLDKLSGIEDRFKQLEISISDPEIIADQDLWRELCKEHSNLSPIVIKFREYKGLSENIEEAKNMLAAGLDKEEKDFVLEELEISKVRIEEVTEELKILLLPKDPNDDKNVIVEIRGGAGGDEAALFASDLLRMYTMYAEKCNWKCEMLSANATDIGGYKEVSFAINGYGAYSKLKFESGVHRVQRVPTTESGGRIHTSTVTVAVLPEVEDVEIEINQNDLRIDVFRAGGPGGQCVNTTDSAVRITHIPTGVVVSCQDERSQHKNKDKAMKILRSRVYDIFIQQQNDAISAERKNQVGTGDRSERIRTYNFPQGRVTDHRIGLTLHKLEAVLNGDLDEIIDALITTDQSEKLKASNG